MDTPRLQALIDKQPVRKIGKDAYNAILEAAEVLFVKKGIGKTPITAIIKMAGVANQTFYDYFPQGKSDLVLMMHLYRRRRMKHAIRNAASHLLLVYYYPEDVSEEARRLSELLPTFLPMYLLVRSVFHTGYEKPTLDHRLLHYMNENNLTRFTLQDGVIFDEVYNILLTLSHGAAGPETIHNLTTVLTTTARSLMDNYWLSHPGEGVTLPTEMERMLIRMYAHLFCQILGETSCEGCRATQRLNLSTLVLPIHEEEVDPERQRIGLPPLTATIPTDHLELGQAQMRMLLDQLDAQQQTSLQ